jgi:HD-like signal output (HDOD) protein
VKPEAGAGAGLDRAALERLLERADALPPCPPVLARVAEICADPDSSARDLGAVIATDEALTSRLIRLVNSAYYGLSGTVATVTQAVVVLGYLEIRNMVYAVRAETVFAEGATSGGIDVLELWDHSLQVAVLARELCYRVRYPVPEEVFVAGVIHDLGQVILNQALGPAYRDFRERAHDDGLDLAAAEEAAWGTSHAEVGRRLTAKWGFPEPLQSGVAGHHRLPPGEPAGLAPFVLAANLAVLGRSRGREARAALAEVPGPVREFLRLDLVRLEEALGRAAEECARLRGTFDLARTEEE